MARLLIYEPSYRRLKGEISKLPGLELLLVSPEGEITLNGVPVSEDDAHPDMGWANGELFGAPASRNYMVALLKAPALKWLQSGAAGYDHPVFGEMVKKGARLTTSHGQAVGMAEYVLAGVLDHFQRGPERRASQASSAWERHPFREIMGSTWLVIGFGAIGQGVAQRAKAFGAKVIGVRRNPEAHPHADRIVAPDAVPGLLPEADVVVLSLPLSAATRHMANAAFFAAMKPRSVLVNVGRGGLVDEPALLAALDAGTPEFAVLDVFETEPLPSDSPFWLHPRVSVNPHASGMGAGANARNEVVFVENLKRFLAGETLIDEADPKDVLGG